MPLLNVMIHEEMKFFSPDGEEVLDKEMFIVYTVAKAQIFDPDSYKYLKQINQGDDASLEFICRLDSTEINGLELYTFDKDEKLIECKLFVRPLKAAEIVSELIRELKI